MPPQPTSPSNAGQTEGTHPNDDNLPGHTMPGGGHYGGGDIPPTPTGPAGAWDPRSGALNTGTEPPGFWTIFFKVLPAILANPSIPPTNARSVAEAMTRELLAAYPKLMNFS